MLLFEIMMVSLGAIYILLEAYFVAAVQIMVYGGAIVVVFLFVVMLLNLGTDELPRSGVRVTKVVLVGLAVAIMARVMWTKCVGSGGTGLTPFGRPSKSEPIAT